MSLHEESEIFTPTGSDLNGHKHDVENILTDIAPNTTTTVLLV